MSEIKQRLVGDSNPNENTRLIKNNTEIEYQTNRKSPTILDSNPYKNTTDSSPNKTARQFDNYDIENRLDINTNNDKTSMQTYKVCISSDTKICKNKWPTPF